MGVPGGSIRGWREWGVGCKEVRRDGGRTDQMGPDVASLVVYAQRRLNCSFKVVSGAVPTQDEPVVPEVQRRIFPSCEKSLDGALLLTFPPFRSAYGGRGGLLSWRGTTSRAWLSPRDGHLLNDFKSSQRASCFKGASKYVICRYGPRICVSTE